MYGAFIRTLVFALALFPSLANAQLAGGLIFPGPGTPASSGGGSTATFDPANQFQVTLGNGAGGVANLSAKNSVGAGQFGNARGTTSKSTGKFYLEWTVTIDAGNQVGIGFSDTTQSFASGFFNGGATHSMGLTITATVARWQFNSGGSTAIAAGGAATNDVIGVAIDVGTGKVWARINAGNWNNDILANQNPATGTGGVAIGLTGAVFFSCDVESTTIQGILNTGGSAYANTAPTGFGSWT